jgi:protein TonB
MATQVIEVVEDDEEVEETVIESTETDQEEII